ncbi:MAG: D-aminoacyl-tRNA deacylase [Candidatus Micrarchaeia archaeon]
MPVVVYSAQDPAAVNIAECLRKESGGVRLVEVRERSVFLEAAPAEADYIVFASRHAGKGGPCLTAHAAGNWGKEAGLGGRPRALSPVPALKLKQAVIELARAAKQIGWPVFMEATHHGPLLPTPLLFMEIGSSEKEWRNEKAAAVVAEAIVRVVLGPPPNATPALGIGGGHYCPAFTRLQLESESAIGHVLQKYAIGGVDEETFRQGIERTLPRAEKVLIDWKGLSASQRKKAISLCEKTGIACGRV